MPLPAMALMAMGGGQIASALLGAFYAKQTALANAISARARINEENFNRQYNIDAQNRSLLSAYRSQQVRNLEIDRAANKERAVAEYWAREGWKNSRSELSKQTAVINAGLLASASGRNINISSGSVKAVLRASLDRASQSLQNLRTSYGSALSDIETAWKSKLAARNFDVMELQSFIPTNNNIEDNANVAFTQALLMGALGGNTGSLAGQLLADQLPSKDASVPEEYGPPKELMNA